MATELELTLFEEELLAVQAMLEAKRWILERGKNTPLELFAVMYPIKKPEDLYKARIRWTDYFGPFSLKFINMETGADNDPMAWPRCHGFRPGSLDACLAWTAEGHGHHPEWKNSKVNCFPKVELPMQYALLMVQSTLDNSYEGRGP